MNQGQKVNSMNIRKALIVLLLSASLPAAAQFTVITHGYEIALRNFQVPTTANSGISFKECDDCEQIRLRVNPDTRYSVNGKTVRLEQFRKVLLQARDRDNPTVVVSHHLESDKVVSISVTHI